MPAETSTSRKITIGLPLVAVLILLPVGGYWLYFQARLAQVHGFYQQEIAQATHAAEDSIQLSVKLARNWEADQAHTAPKEFAESTQGFLETVDRNGQDPCESEKLAAFHRNLEICARQGMVNALFRISPKAIFNKIPFSDTFEMLFLADDKGRVIFSRSNEYRSGNPGWNRVNDAIEKQQNPGTEMASVADLTHLVDSKGVEIKLASLQGSSARTDIFMAGRRYHLYVEPMRLPDIEARWFLGGVVRSETVLHRAAAINVYYLPILVGFLLMCLLGWPFFKLAFIDPRERWKMADVFWLHLSCIALLLLATVAILAQDAFGRFNRRAEQGMKEIALTIERNFVNELRAAQAALELQDKAFLEKVGQVELREHPAFIDQFLVVDSKGAQILRARPISENEGPLINTINRPYFQAVQRGDLWRFAQPPATAGFSVAPLRSIVNGIFFTFLAEPSQRADGSVALARLSLASLGPQDLPRDHIFCIIDRDGMIIYHSDPRRALRETLFEEVDDPLAVEALLDSPVAEFADIHYQSQPYQLHVHRLGGIVYQSKGKGLEGLDPNWYIVVMRQKSGPLAVAMRAVVLALIWPLVILIPLLGLGLRLACWRSERLTGRAWAWFWPSEAKAGIYRQMVWLLAAVSIVLGALIVILDGAWLLVVGFLTVFIAIVGGVLMFQKMQRINEQDPREPLTRSTVRWHVGNLTLLMFCLSCLPAFGGLKFFWNHQFGKVERAEAKDWVTRYNGLRQRLSIDDPPNSAAKYVADRDIYMVQKVAGLGLDLNGKLPPAARHEQQIPGFVERWIPPNDPWLARIRFEDASALPWGNVGGGGVLPRTLLFLLTLLGITAGWIYYASDWLFFSRQPGNARARPCTTENLTVDERRVLLQVSDEGFSNPRAREIVLSLLARGYLTLAPDLKVACRRVADELRAEARSNPQSVKECELPDSGFGWRRARWIVVILVLAVSLFLAVTQPDLSTEVVGSVTAMTAAVAALRGTFDKISSWFSSKPT